ncbi:hypothetical protein ACAH01_00805 [Halomicrobium sp. HM KBTZ05]|uniref:hypothetical protein n=1 Tax=Halomicrobium sp. HM KBTZ05 TaxID=3242663 RepID=UPI0035592731
MREDPESSELTRRKTLRMLAASGIGLGFASSNAAAKGDRTTKDGRRRKGDNPTVAEGTSGFVTSNRETPDWFTIKDDGKYNLQEVKRTSDQEISTQGHDGCPNDSIVVSFDKAIKGFPGGVINVKIHHCAGDQCDWGVELTLLEQSADFGTTDDCNGRLETTHTIQAVTIDGYVEAHTPWNTPVGVIHSWTINLDARWYNPIDGWQEGSVEAKVDNPVV